MCSNARHTFIEGVMASDGPGLAAPRYYGSKGLPSIMLMLCLRHWNRSTLNVNGRSDLRTQHTAECCLDDR